MMKTREKNRTSVGMLVASVLVATMVAFPAIAGAALVNPGATLTLGGSTDDRIHPALTAPPAYKRFNVYTGTALDLNGWTSVASLSPDYDDGAGELKGKFYSEVWRKDNHLLFAYMIENTGTSGIHTGDMNGYGSNIGVVDCGVMHFGGSDAYANYDVLQLSRAMNAGVPQVRFYFDAVGDDRYLPGGESSTWFYFETDVNEWESSIGTVKNSGKEADIEMLVPVPEPATMILLAAGAAGLLLKRRRSA